MAHYKEVIDMADRQMGAQLPRVAISVLLAILLAGCSTTKANFHGDSMEPNIQDGAQLTFERVALADLQRGDVILFDYKDYLLVKRVIGLPGETVAIHDGQVFVNARALVESYDILPPSYTMAEVLVPDGSYFVLGDNRDNSSDSHLWGPLAGDAIRGKLID